MDAIVAYDLSKQYGGSVALCGLNLTIPEGRAFACVGEGNSGKTTLIRLLSGLCRPTMGECTVLGYSPFFEAEKLHAAAGTVLSTARLYESLTLAENLRFFAGLNGVDENDALDRMSFLLHKLDIWEGRDKKVDDLPTGVVRRASLARALMHSPRVLLMDEPAAGLDKETEDSVQGLISHLVDQEGVTVLLCTRNMDYAQELCGGFALLQKGSLLAKGDLESLRQGAGVRYRALLRLGEGDPPPKGFRFQDGFWQKEVDAEDELPKLVSRAVEDGKRLFEARLMKPTLEEIYRAFLEGGKQRAGAADEQEGEYDEYQEQEERSDENYAANGDGGPEAGSPDASRTEAGTWESVESDGEGEG